MNQSKVIAPIDMILPSFIPIFLEKGIPGYAEAPLAPGEIRISRESLVAVLIASGFIGTLVHATYLGFDYDRVKDLLTHSVNTINCINPCEVELSLQLVEQFLSYPILREDHLLEDWVCETFWSTMQTSNYKFPSAMSSAVAYGTRIMDSLQKCTVEY